MLSANRGAATSGSSACTSTRPTSATASATSRRACASANSRALRTATAACEANDPSSARSSAESFWPRLRFRVRTPASSSPVSIGTPASPSRSWRYAQAPPRTRASAVTSSMTTGCRCVAIQPATPSSKLRLLGSSTELIDASAVQARRIRRRSLMLASHSTTTGVRVRRASASVICWNSRPGSSSCESERFTPASAWIRRSRTSSSSSICRRPCMARLNSPASSASSSPPDTASDVVRPDRRARAPASSVARVARIRRLISHATSTPRAEAMASPRRFVRSRAAARAATLSLEIEATTTHGTRASGAAPRR